MDVNNEFFIVKWDLESTNPYLFGTDLKLLNNNAVQFRNQYIPSGTVIQSWSSGIVFHSERRANNLPQLSREKRYKISYKVKALSGNSTYLKLDCIDIMNEVIETHVIKQGKEVEFIVPAEISTYNIYLVSAGCDSMIFENIIIKSAEVPSFSVEKYWIDDSRMVKTSDKITIIFIEPLYHRIGTIPKEYLEAFENVIVVNSGYEDAKLYMSETLVQQIKDVIRFSGASNIEYIGYGPISNFSALMYSRFQKHAKAKITDAVYNVDQYNDIIDYYNLNNISIKQILLERYNTEKVTLYMRKKNVEQLFVSRFNNPSHYIMEMV